jgi:DeoR family transcriptional regulator, fructose operon transcriptional repressor
MIAEERRLRIRELLTTQRTLSVSELTERLGVTLATVRRDLAILERDGVLVRSHGGAVSRSSSADFQPSYEFLLRSNRSEKIAIAMEAERLILDGDIVFLEGSTTVYELACLLASHQHLTTVTNSPPILERLQHSSAVTVMSTGGELQKDTYYLCGAWAQQAISEIRVDKAIFGVSAIDPSYGISTSRPAQAEIKKLLVKASKTRIALVDHTKFGKQTFAYVGPITDFQIIITDSATSPEHIAAIRKAGVEVLIAQTTHLVRAKRSDTLQSKIDQHR